MQAIEVNANFAADGKITPLRFTWQGQVYPIISTGRRWGDDQGLHILVMVPGEKVYELIFDAADLKWYLKTILPDQAAA